MEDLEKLIKMVWASEGKTPVLVGEPGCGKTTTVNALAEKDGAYLKVLNLSSFEAIDMNGMPFVDNGELKVSDPAWYTEVLPTGQKVSERVKFIAAMNTAKDLEGFVEFSNAFKDRMFMIPFVTDPVEWRKMFENNFGKPQSEREKSVRKELSKFLETNPQLLEGRKPVSASTYGITDEAEATTVEYTTPNRRNWDNLANGGARMLEKL